MPIKFRCEYCRQLMGIAHTKAGSLVDCPTCGRSLRVPNEDGTVGPPPPAVGLDPADDGLRRALDELGQLGPPEKRPNPVPSEPPPAPLPANRVGPESISGAQETPPAFVKPVVVIPPPQLPGAQPNAIALDPLPRVEAVNAPVHLQVNSIEPDLAARTTSLNAASPQQVLAGLAGSASPAQSVPPATPQPRTYALKWMILTGVVSGLVGGGIGYQLGSSYGRRPNIAVPNVVAPEATSGGSLAKPQVKGRLTFSNVQGQFEPDAGACVILLPGQRAGMAKLPAAGFRPNDDTEARELAMKTLQEQGGQLAITDAEGNYQFELPEAGDYTLIALSHFQGRAPDDPGRAEALQVIADIFERPEQLTGKLAFEAAKIKHTGTGIVIWDQTFANRP